MGHYCGLDVSLKEVSVCPVDAQGAVLNRATLPKEPDIIADCFAQETPNAERIVHHSGLLATWLTREPERRAVSINCIDARMAHKALSARLLAPQAGQDDPDLLLR